MTERLVIDLPELPQTPEIKAELLGFLGQRGIEYKIEITPEILPVPPVINSIDLDTYAKNHDWKKRTGTRVWASLTKAYALGGLKGLQFGVDVHENYGFKFSAVRSVHMGDLDLSSLRTSFNEAKTLASHSDRYGRKQYYGPNFSGASITFLDEYVNSPEVQQQLDSAKLTE